MSRQVSSPDFTGSYVKIRASHQVALMVKNPPVNARNVKDAGSIPVLGRSLGEGHFNPFRIFAWRIPWTEEPGGLQSIRSQRVGHD